jgi:hypothetical protein
MEEEGSQVRGQHNPEKVRETLSQKQNTDKRYGDMAQVLERLPTMGSIPSTTGKKKCKTFYLKQLLRGCQNSVRPQCRSRTLRGDDREQEEGAQGLVCSLLLAGLWLGVAYEGDTSPKGQEF